MSEAQSVTGATVPGAGAVAPDIKPVQVSVPQRVEVPVREVSSAEREEAMARLREALASAGVEELRMSRAYLRIEPNAATRELEIAVFDAETDQMIRRIPPDSLKEMLRPDVFPRGLLLRLVTN